MNTFSKIRAGYAALGQKAYVGAGNFLARHALSILIVAGVSLLAIGLVDATFAQSSTFDDTRIREAGDFLLTDLIEGSFGALVMIVSGLVAIIAAAMGAYRAAMACLVIAVGAFILRSFVTLFFPDVTS